MKQLEGMILIETFVSWFLGVISNGIGEKVKENTWYTLKNGELMEVEDE